VAKYQNRIDPNLTWTGKGRKPEWVITFLANGGTLEELEIKSN
jgi:DNA-binding protein H-NS